MGYQMVAWLTDDVVVVSVCWSRGSIIQKLGLFVDNFAWNFLKGLIKKRSYFSDDLGWIYSFKHLINIHVLSAVWIALIVLVEELKVR